ncbi:MAG: cupin domain-containing protein [Saprospiraceae bacterium]|nr:cupin domain-containing protein [Saprospiraceae bacterium]
MPTVYSTDISRELYTRERCHIVEILNHNNCENLSIARARVEPGVTTEWHRLDVDEAYYILAGQGRMELNGVHETVKPGDVVHLAAGIPQCITNTGSTDLLFLCICTPRFLTSSYRSCPPL